MATKGEKNQHRQVDNELRSYLQHVKQLLDKNEFEDEEERQILINNVFSELRHKEVNIATHSGVTRMLEGFLPLFSPYKLRAFLFHIRGKYVRLSTDPADSHILEKIIGLFSKFLGDESADANEEVDEDDETAEKEEIPTSVQVLLNVCTDFAEDWGNLAMDSYGTHVVRTLVRVMAGLPPTESNNNDQNKEETTQQTVPKKLQKKAIEVVNITLKQLQDDKHKVHEIIFHRYACPTIQTLLAVLDKLDNKRMSSLISDLLMLDSADSEAARKHIDKALRHPIASHLVEKALQLCSPDVYVKIYSNFFRHHIVDYGLDPSANYVVQQLISSARHHAQPKLILDELLEDPKSIASLFKTGKGGVIVKLADTLHKFSDIQKKDKKKLCTSIRGVFLKASEDVSTSEAQTDGSKAKGNKKERTMEFDLKALLQVQASVRENPTNIKKKKKRKSPKSDFSPIGCRLAQSLMIYPFDCVDFMLNSFQTLDKDFLVSMSLDTAASRVVEAYLDDSCQAPTKHKLKLIRTMQGAYSKLAVDPCGSHIVEKCYKAADVQIKGLIAEELMVDEKKLDAEKYGKAVLIKCKIGQYKMKKEAWTEKATSIDKKRKMFEDILNDQDDDLLPAAGKQAEKESALPEPSEKGKKVREVAFVEDKFGSEALREELQRLQSKEKQKKQKADARGGKRKQLDAVESQMMELLGYSDKSDRKRQRDESSDDEDHEEEDEDEDHASSNDRRSAPVKDTSMSFILDVIAATKSTRRAEPPKLKEKKKQQQKTSKRAKKKAKQDVASDE